MPTTSEDDNWRARLNNGEFELSLDELSRWIDSKRVTAATPLLAPGATQWKPAGSFAELDALFDDRNQRRSRKDDERIAHADARREAAATAERRRKLRIAAAVGGSVIAIGSIVAAFFLYTKQGELAVKVAWYGVATGIVLVLLAITRPRS